MAIGKISARNKVRFVWRSFLVFIVFMLIDYVYYGLLVPSNPYGQDLVNKITWTCILAVGFTYAHWMACYRWWGPIPSPKITHMQWNNTKWGMLFGFVVGVVCLAAIALSCYIVSVFYIYALEAFRGIPETASDDLVLLAKTTLAGLTAEHAGKEEAGGDR